MAQSTAPQALEVRDLVKHYASVQAVNGVSFSVAPGEIFGLLGPNGAGKTSIISVIVTLEKPTSGQIQVFGHDVTKEAKAGKRLLGWVPQEIINHGFFDVEEILKFHSGFYGLASNQKQIEFLLNRLGLCDHRHKKVRQLSGGMKRRLMIAKALVHQPRLLLLDEPTAGVDIELREVLWRFIHELREQGLSVLLTTHYLEEAEELCDRVGIIHGGKIRTQGATKTLIQTMTHRRISFIAQAATDMTQHPAFVESKPDGTYVFQIPMAQELGGFLHQLKIDLGSLKNLVIQDGTLEDAVRQILGKAQNEQV